MVPSIDLIEEALNASRNAVESELQLEKELLSKGLMVHSGRPHRSKPTKESDVTAGQGILDAVRISVAGTKLKEKYIFLQNCIQLLC